MIDTAMTTAKGWVRRVKDAFGDKKPHFNFITIHYFWIIGATIFASILIYAGGRGNIDYIDALLFASGANTQAGLNSVDLNLLNTFQQIVIYIFTMMSSPITLHGCVVFLRLYWFEKRFQHWVRDARARRGTLSKSKSKARNHIGQDEEARGVQGRNITVVPPTGQNQRMTNDGILIEGGPDGQQKLKPEPQGSDTSESNTVIGELNSFELSGLSKIEEGLLEDRDADQRSLERQISPATEPKPGPLGHQPTIQFADQVKRSDTLDDTRANETRPQARSHAEHIAILERQRKTDDDEILRIPGPRETERGLGPTRLKRDAEEDYDHSLAPTRTYESTLDRTREPAHPIRERHPTITIAEPDHRMRDEIVEDAAAIGSTVDTLRLRKPRIFNRGQRRFHEDNEEDEPTPATRVKTRETLRSFLTRDKTMDDMPYLSYNPTMGRNSNFVGLSLEEREELGGIEYRSLRTLALVIVGYFWGFQILAFTFFLPWIRESREYSALVENIGQSPIWWAFWTANSAFMDLGFTLTPDSMISFAKSQYILMIMTFFIIIGNTGFPVMLRFIIWVMSNIASKGSGLWEELRFLLDHPRRCFTLLFPSQPTWWLFAILVILNVVDLVCFIVLDLNAEVVQDLSIGTRIVNGLFQSASTRTAGFSSVPLSGLQPAMPVLYMVMMYISVFPIAISIRRTNVYEEKSLGVYHDKKEDDDTANDPSAVSYVGTHLRRQLSFDLWYVALGFFVIAISEGSKLEAGRFDLFSVLFEIVSAYGTVGLSIGVPNVNASLCSQFSVVGKLVICAMMIRGRHRGLPYGLDRAVLLPSESRFENEAQDSQLVLVRTPTARSGRTSVDARRASSLPRPRSLSRTRDRNIISSLLHPGPAISRSETHGHRRNTSTTSHGFNGPRLSQVQSQPIVDSDGESLARAATREPRVAPPRRAETEPYIHEA
ncbi:cation transport protein [Sarocladium implicatum]|nr:cation transport protein [Sarocladium implicatum]